MIIALEQKLPKTGEEVPVYVANKTLSKQGVTKEDLAIMSIGGTGLGIILLFGGKIATTALLISVMTVGSGAILWIKMPEKVADVPLIGSIIKKLPISKKKKEWILSQNWKEKAEDHELLIDILVSAGVFVLFGSTLTGLVAAGVTGLAVSAIFRVRKIVRRVSFQVRETVRSI